ncbi:Uncharacterised protein [Vibrio cholerae]|nr:Uncharacterised protein [Vibrio cholerae]
MYSSSRWRRSLRRIPLKTSPTNKCFSRIKASMLTTADIFLKIIVVQHDLGDLSFA